MLPLGMIVCDSSVSRGWEAGGAKFFTVTKRGNGVVSSATLRAVSFQVKLGARLRS